MWLLVGIVFLIIGLLLRKNKCIPIVITICD